MKDKGPIQSDIGKREKILAFAKTLPAMSTSATRVLQIIRYPNYDIADLSGAIECDPATTLNVLRLANSAFFGCARTIGSAKEAIIRLGSQNVLGLVIASAVAPTVQKAIKGYDIPPGGLWEHCVFVAICTREIASTLGLKIPDMAFTTGLVHDIGKMVLGPFIDVEKNAMFKLANEESLSFEAVEQRVLGIDHAEAGAFLLERWNLPVPIVEAVRFHHMPEGCAEDRLVVDAVSFCDSLSCMAGLGHGRAEFNYHPSKSAAERFQIQADVLDQIVVRTLESTQEMRKWFKS